MTHGPSRRGLFAATGGILAALGSKAGAVEAPLIAPARDEPQSFWGAHQAGISLGDQVRRDHTVSARHQRRHELAIEIGPAGLAVHQQHG